MFRQLASAVCVQNTGLISESVSQANKSDLISRHFTNTPGLVSKISGQLLFKFVLIFSKSKT